MARVEKVTENNKACTVNIALNYGSRDEIVGAVKKIAEKVKNGEVDIENIDDKLVSDNLYTYYMPDPDLVIRSSGEERLSNFLMWQSAYSELYFTDTLWPDFDEDEFTKAIEAYISRNRRFGGR
jgi:undecaprenyl diphosphate synthase